MNKYFLSLILLFTIFSIPNSYAELSTSILLLRNTPILDYQNIEITNAQGKPLPNTSGLYLYEGDTLHTDSESVILFISTFGTIVEVYPYTKVRFDVLSLGGREYVIQLYVDEGKLKVSTYKNNDLFQIIPEIIPPQETPRVDNLTNEFNDVYRLYIQVISNDAEVDTSNVDIQSHIFVTKPNTDIVEIINTLRRIQSSSDLMERILTLPTPRPELSLSLMHDIAISAHFIDVTQMQTLSFLYRLHYQKSKLQFSLQVPLFFVRDNNLFNPFGQQDMSFGAPIWADTYNSMANNKRILLGGQHILLDLLGKIQKISYGTPDDLFYVYFGNQDTWHNPNSTLFAYHYRPVRAFVNNFNKDFLLRVNTSKVGNDLRFRQFQLPSLTSPLFANIDLLYNRVWFKPFVPLYNIEFGLVLAMDFNINKFSDNDNEVNIFANDENKMLFTSVDITAPIVNSSAYQFNMSIEGGWWGLITDIRLVGTPEGLNNWGAKLGMSHNIFSLDKNITNSLESNVYFTSGMFRPHFAMGGYEYFQKPLYNKVVTNIIEGQTSPAMLAYAVSPELTYSLKSDVFSMDVMSYYPLPLPLGTSLSPVYNNLTVGFNLALDARKFLPKNINVKFSFFYANSNMEFANWNLFNIFTFIGPSYATIDTKVTTEIMEKFTIDVGYYNTPRYNDTTLVFDNTTGLPSMMQVPYISFAVKF